MASQIERVTTNQPVSDRLVSMSDPDVRPVRKGKLGKPTQFGYVTQLAEVTPHTRPRGTRVPAASALGRRLDYRRPPFSVSLSAPPSISSDEITKPEPRDVLVVGNVLKSRRGETGIAGPHGTLDTLTIDELRQLRRIARHTPNAAYDSWGIKRPVRPARSYPEVFRRNRQRMADARAQVDAWYPIHRMACFSLSVPAR